MMRLLLMVTVSPRLWLISLMMYFILEPPVPGPREERLARILPALTHLMMMIVMMMKMMVTMMMTSDHSPDGGAGATLHHALDADVDAWADPDQGLDHLVIIIKIRWSANIFSSHPPHLCNGLAGKVFCIHFVPSLKSIIK